MRIVLIHFEFLPEQNIIEHIKAVRSSTARFGKAFLSSKPTHESQRKSTLSDIYPKKLNSTTAVNAGSQALAGRGV